MIFESFFRSGPSPFYLQHKAVLDGYYHPERNVSWIDHLLAHSYQLALVLTAVVLIWVLLSPSSRKAIARGARMTEKQLFRFYLAVVPIFSVAGWLWGILVQCADPSFPSWFFPPWTCSNIYIGNQLLEDWLFYPITGVCNATILLFVFSLEKKKIADFKNRRVAGIVFEIAYVAILVFFSLLDTCGRTLVLCFGLPAWVLFKFGRVDIHYKAFSFVWIPLMIASGVVYDFLLVFAPGHLLHKPFAEAWSYEIPLPSGSWHSNIFSSAPWSWVGNIPLSIDPGMAVLGGLAWYLVGSALRRMILVRVD